MLRGDEKEYSRRVDETGQRDEALWDAFFDQLRRLNMSVEQAIEASIRMWTMFGEQEINVAPQRRADVEWLSAQSRVVVDRARQARAESRQIREEKREKWLKIVS